MLIERMTPQSQTAQRRRQLQFADAAGDVFVALDIPRPVTFDCVLDKLPFANEPVGGRDQRLDYQQALEQFTREAGLVA